MLSLLILIGCLLATTDLAAGGKAKEDETVAYTELGRNQGLHDGIIIEANAQTAVTQLSFAGETTIDGIKKESDNSHNQINLSDIRSITVIDPLFESKRYPQQEFCLVKIHTTHDYTEEVLMPRHLVICGQAVESHIKKSWALRTLKKIKISDN
jgi:hypothetical protein